MGSAALEHTGALHGAGLYMRVVTAAMDRTATLVERPTELVLVLNPDEWTEYQVDYLIELLARL